MGSALAQVAVTTPAWVLHQPFIRHDSCPSVHLSVRFHQDDQNCFTFCLKFINGVLAAEGHSPLSRDTFTLSFIVPRMRRVSQFMRLYQHLQFHQYYIVDRRDR